MLIIPKQRKPRKRQEMWDNIVFPNRWKWAHAPLPPPRTRKMTDNVCVEISKCRAIEGSSRDDVAPSNGERTNRAASLEMNRNVHYDVAPFNAHRDALSKMNHRSLDEPGKRRVKRGT